ncbi:hypothetical protein Landi51_12275 [Colletotrichum acutatum]
MRDSDFLLDEFVAAVGAAVQCQCQGSYRYVLGVPCAMHIHNLVSLVHPMSVTHQFALSHSRLSLSPSLPLPLSWLCGSFSVSLLFICCLAPALLYGAFVHTHLCRRNIHSPQSASLLSIPYSLRLWLIQVQNPQSTPKEPNDKTLEYTRNAIHTLPNKTIVTPPSPCTFSFILRPFSSSTLCRLFDRGFNFATSAKSKVVTNALLNGSSVSGFNVSSFAIRHPHLVSSLL